MQQGNEQQAKVIKYLIKNTPFGQANLVVKDLCKILPQLDGQDPLILESIKEHNEEHLAVFKGQENYIIITSILNAQEDFYVDQKKGQTVKVDHEKLQIVSIDTVDLPKNEGLDSFRDVLENELQHYLTTHFKEQMCGVYVMYTGDVDDYSFYIGISAKNINLPNLYCGDWISTWEITKTKIAGEIKIQAHYYEEGNVQLKNSANIQENINLELTNENAKMLVDFIGQQENKHQNNMGNVYDKMPDLFFKTMRRQLPITGTKMNWDQDVHKLVANLKL